MKNRILGIIVLIVISSNIFAQEVINDIIQVNYGKKSARKAMILSGIFPGAGQFYADKSSKTGYIFPVIEIGMWAGYIYFTNAGNNKEEDFKKYADEHYYREYYNEVRDDLVGVYNDDNDYGAANNPGFYGYYDDEHDEGLFRLDSDKTQHYYEDIGKYEKYIFGWSDWYGIYASDEEGNFVNPDWGWENDAETHKKWSNMAGPTNPNHPDYLANQTLYDQQGGKYSTLRQGYIDLRNDSKDLHSMARNFNFGVALNHIFAALDAVRVTRSRNLEYISSNRLQIQVVPNWVNDNFAPALLLSKRF